MKRIDTEWLKMQMEAYKVNPPIEGSVGEGHMLAIEELLGYREGYDPNDKQPEPMVWLTIRYADGFVEDDFLTTDGKFPRDSAVVLRWYPAVGHFVDDRK